MADDVNEPSPARRVLVVDDNPGDVELILLLLADVLTPAAHTHVARDGVEALDFLHRRGAFEQAPRPDLILLDLNMPRVGGMEVLRRIRADEELRSIPVAILSTSSSEQDRERCAQLGADLFLTKPHRLDEFRRVLATVQPLIAG